MNKAGFLSPLSKGPLLCTTGSTTSLLGASGVEGCTNIQTRHQSYLAQLRRMKTRRQWASKNAFSERPDADFFDYPRERLGRHYDLNWGLHKYKIAPASEAFRNLHLRGLVMNSIGTADAKKALHVKLGEGEDNYGVYYGENTPKFLKSTKPISIDNYKQIVKQVKDHLSNVDQLYVHDGAVGSHSHCENRIRAITDNAASALYLHHLLPRVAIRRVADFQHSLTAYIAPNFKIAKPESLGLKDSNFVILDIVRGIVFIGGTPSTKAVRTALSGVVAPRLLMDRNFLPLQAEIVNIADQERPLLVFSSENVSNHKGIKVEGSHNVAWGPQGLYRFFEGVTSPYTKDMELNKGDLIEEIVGKDGKGTPLRATTRRAPVVNTHPHPSAIVYVVADASGVLPIVSKIKGKGVNGILLAGPTGSDATPFKPIFTDNPSVDPLVVVEKFGNLVNENKVGAYLVNVSPKGSKLTSKDVAEIFTAIGAGHANINTAPPTISSTFFAPISTLKGVSTNLDPLKRASDSAYIKQLADYETQLSSYNIANFQTQHAQPQ